MQGLCQRQMQLAVCGPSWLALNCMLRSIRMPPTLCRMSMSVNSCCVHMRWDFNVSHTIQKQRITMEPLYMIFTSPLLKL